MKYISIALSVISILAALYFAGDGLDRFMVAQEFFSKAERIEDCRKIRELRGGMRDVTVVDRCAGVEESVSYTPATNLTREGLFALAFACLWLVAISVYLLGLTIIGLRTQSLRVTAGE